MIVYIDKDGHQIEISSLGKEEFSMITDVYDRYASLNSSCQNYFGKHNDLARVVQQNKEAINALTTSLNGVVSKGDAEKLTSAVASIQARLETLASKLEVESLSESLSSVSGNVSRIMSSVYSKDEVNRLLPDMTLYPQKSELPNYNLYASKASVEALNTDIDAVKDAIVGLGVKQYVGDANDITLDSKYVMKVGSVNVPDTPCYLEVLAASADFVIQRVTLSDGVERRRVYNGSEWSEWS